MNCYLIQRGDSGPRVPFAGEADEAVALTKRLARTWLDEASLLDPTTGRTIVTFEPPLDSEAA